MVRLAGVIRLVLLVGASAQNIIYDRGSAQRLQPLSQYQPQQRVQQPPQYQQPQHVQQPDHQQMLQQQTEHQQHQHMYQQWQRQSLQQQPYQQPHSLHQQPHPQSYQQPHYAVQPTYQQPPRNEQYPPPVQKQEGGDDAMIPISMNQDDSFAPQMLVKARFKIDFGDLVIEQGAQGQIISRKGEPIVVRWDRIGDRPAAAAQLIAVDGPTFDDEDVYVPKMKRDKEVQAPEKKKEVVAETPSISIARMEDKRVKEALEKKAAEAAGNGKDDATV